jgi:hypothetical protein
MPLPLITDVYRVALQWVGPSASAGVNVLHVRSPANTVTQVAFDFRDATHVNMWVTIPDSFAVANIKVDALDGTGAQAVLNTLGTPGLQGGTGSNEYSPAVAALVSLRTDLSGRTHRGRVYVGPTSEEAQAQGHLTVPTQATLQTAWDAFINELTTKTIPQHLCIASYTTATSRDVTQAIVRFGLGTQRRRQSRVTSGI